MKGTVGMSNNVTHDASTNQSCSENKLKKLEPLIEATDGLSLSQVCSITDLEPSTIQNWVKRGFVSRPMNKKYRQRQLARIMLISALRDGMPIDRIGELMSRINGNANDESDDIVPEENLYDYYCKVVSTVDASAANVEDQIRTLLSYYVPPNEGAFERLSEALTVMLFAHTASEFKNLSDLHFRKITAVST